MSKEIFKKVVANDPKALAEIKLAVLNGLDIKYEIDEVSSYSKELESLKSKIKTAKDNKDLEKLEKEVKDMLDKKKISASDFDELTADIGRKMK